MHWAFGPENEEWDKPKRNDLVLFYVSWLFDMALQYGCCFGIVEKDGKLKAVIATFPPGSIADGHVDSFWRKMTTLWRVGMPPYISNPKLYGSEVSFLLTQRSNHELRA